jgi:DNA polymerase-3 subunit epsilon
MIGGRQTALGLGSVTGASGRLRQSDVVEEIFVDIFARPAPLPSRLTEEELAAHAALVAKLGAKGIWSKYSASE